MCYISMAPVGKQVTHALNVLLGLSFVSSGLAMGASTTKEWGLRPGIFIIRSEKTFSLYDTALDDHGTGIDIVRAALPLCAISLLLTGVVLLTNGTAKFANTTMLLTVVLFFVVLVGILEASRKDRNGIKVSTEYPGPGIFLASSALVALPTLLVNLLNKGTATIIKKSKAGRKKGVKNKSKVKVEPREGEVYVDEHGTPIPFDMLKNYDLEIGKEERPPGHPGDFLANQTLIPIKMEPGQPEQPARPAGLVTAGKSGGPGTLLSILNFMNSVVVSVVYILQIGLYALILGIILTVIFAIQAAVTSVQSFLGSFSSILGRFIPGFRDISRFEVMQGEDPGPFDQTL
jgi:hypothetical protein